MSDSEKVKDEAVKATECPKPVFLKRGQILGADDLHQEEVFIPEWGGTVIVRTLTGIERDSFEAEVVEVTQAKFGAKRNIRARLVARCCVDNEGNRLFQDEDIPLLGKKSNAALDRVFDVATRLNAITKSDVEELQRD